MRAGAGGVPGAPAAVPGPLQYRVRGSDELEDTVREKADPEPRMFPVAVTHLVPEKMAKG